MKRIASCFLLVTLLLLAFSACAEVRLDIEGYEWHLRTAMTVKGGELTVVATDGTDAVHSEAKTVDITLKVDDGRLTIIDSTNGKTYEGTYRVEGRNPRGTDYKVTVDGKEGYATVAMTTYADGGEEPTLPINLGEYSLYFYS